MSPHSLFSGRKAGLEGVAEIKSANFLIEIQLLKSQGVLSSIQHMGKSLERQHEKAIIIKAFLFLVNLFICYLLE